MVPPGTAFGWTCASDAGNDSGETGVSCPSMGLEIFSSAIGMSSMTSSVSALTTANHPLPDRTSTFSHSHGRDASRRRGEALETEEIKLHIVCSGGGDGSSEPVSFDEEEEHAERSEGG